MTLDSLDDRQRRELLEGWPDEPYRIDGFSLPFSSTGQPCRPLPRAARRSPAAADRPDGRCLRHRVRLDPGRARRSSTQLHRPALRLRGWRRCGVEVAMIARRIAACYRNRPTGSCSFRCARVPLPRLRYELDNFGHHPPQEPWSSSADNDSSRPNSRGDRSTVRTWRLASPYRSRAPGRRPTT